MTRVERWERRTEWPLAATALAFLVAFAWPILDTHLSAPIRHSCRIIDYGAWALFVIDYAVRLGLAERRLSYAGRHLADLLIIALPVFRPLRLLRLVVFLRVLNKRATTTLRGRVAFYVVSATGLVVFCAALAELDAERHNPHANIATFHDSLWWAATTVSTVGYGDHYPVTTEGRLVAVGLMIAGVALLGVVTGSVATWLIERVREVEEASQAATRADMVALHAELAALRRQVSALGEPEARPPAG